MKISGESVQLVAIINSFNRRQLLERAITSLAGALRGLQFGSAIVVFEAGSTDGSLEFLKSWKEKYPGDSLSIIEASAGQSSFSDGVNLACAEALARFPGARWLLLYETDNCCMSIEPLEKAIALLEREPRLAAVGFTVRQHDGSSFGYGMRFPSTLSFVLGQNLAGSWNFHAPNDANWQTNDGIQWRKCDVVFTSPLLVRREAWSQSGGFDAVNFPFSDSDLDWAWRCAGLGWEMGVIATSDVIHDNLAQPSGWSANRVLDFHRNRFRLLRRHRGRNVALLKPVLFLRHGIETIILKGRSRSDPAAKEKLARRKQLLRTVWRNYS
jgi:GT2 family glycosyltransferase